MPLPFDATLKDLVRSHPADFEALLHLRGPGPAAAVNVDLATISAATDVTLGYGTPPALLADLNFQAGPDAALPARVRLYNALLHHRYGVPVHSVVILLRPRADPPALTGRLSYQALSGRGRVDFRYEVVRLWRRPARRLLAAGPGAMPLAVLGRLPAGRATDDGLALVVGELDRRIRRMARPAEARRLLTAAFVLTGLRVDEATARQVFERVTAMRESSTYRGILREGQAEGIQQVLFELGRKRFGPPDADTRAALKAITDVKRLMRMSKTLLDVTSWHDLLATR